MVEPLVVAGAAVAEVHAPRIVSGGSRRPINGRNRTRKVHLIDHWRTLGGVHQGIQLIQCGQTPVSIAGQRQATTVGNRLIPVVCVWCGSLLPYQTGRGIRDSTIAVIHIY